MPEALMWIPETQDPVSDRSNSYQVCDAMAVCLDEDGRLRLGKGQLFIYALPLISPET